MVLIVEDDPALQAGLRVALVAAGYHVTVAEDGAEGVRRARSMDPDVIVFDMGLPIIDGWEAVRLVRTSTKRPRIIALSGMDDARSRQRAFDAGCDEFIAKPFAVPDLLGALRAHFVGRGTHGAGPSEAAD
jgi:DNA-binding response OmpR family regulator